MQYVKRSKAVHLGDLQMAGDIAYGPAVPGEDPEDGSDVNDTPPPVLADALGLNPQTAIRHARRGSGQYGAYVADRMHADT
jgi:hypothetical protein